MKEEKKKNLQVRLPRDVVTWIDLDAEKKGLKRGPTCRMVLIDALNSVHESELKQLQFVFNHKFNMDTDLIAFEITDQMNKKLLDLCKYIPVSKKKLAEILICQRVELVREE